DARIVQQLRMAGYRIGALKALMPQLQQMRQRDEVLSTLAARGASITSRSRALLQAASALNELIDASEPRSRS
ncbi:MAG: MerR family transcriptional regulator, partial [Micromonosporaceae bacterium]